MTQPLGAGGGHVFYRNLHRKLPRIVRGQGVFLFDAEGKRYLDASGGAMVANVGHGVREIADAIGAQASTLAYVNGTAFTNEPVEALADALIAKAPPDIDKAYFLSSGSEAVEAALKLARQYHVERGELSRRVIIARTPGYHGNTLLALSASAREHYRAVFEPWLLDVRMIPAPYPYRDDSGGASPAMTGDALEAAIVEHGAHNVAAFIAEPIGGSSTGASVPAAGYYARIREICDRHGVLFIADEVLTGVGRTGRFFGLEHYHDRAGGSITPDIITLGKGLNGGYVALSALLASKKVFATIAGGKIGGLMHAQTYSHHAVACAAGLATLRYLEQHDLVRRAASLGAVLQQRLGSLTSDGRGAAIVGDVRGLGMLAAVEFVADRDSKRPFPRAVKIAERLVDAALQRGLVLWPNSGHADGTNGDLVMVAPPFTISETEIDTLVSLLRDSIADVARELTVPAAGAVR
ncbi:MAG: aspartate aminotransferase family protein [Candidatus Eremiobacteraeota bacterium]|nr:aspartate aminotransferase family protein [Candidatus Eremiobacteraeota bacterium]